MNSTQEAPATAGASPMSAAEFACWRRLTGLAGDQLAERMRAGGLNPRTVRDWEQGRRPVPEWAADRIEQLASENAALARRIADAETVVEIPRDGWHIQAAAMALLIDPEVMIEWRADQ